MAVTPAEIDLYNRMMASGGIVPGSIPADKLAELQLATGTTTYRDITKSLPARGPTTIEDSIIPGDPSTFPVYGASFATVLPWLVSGGLALWDIVGEGIGGDPGPVLPGNGRTPAVPNLPLVGPGVPEPPNSMVTSRWETRVYDNKLGYVKMNFYALTDGRIAMYHNYKKYWRVWRPKKNVVISSNPRLSHLKKLARLNKRVEKTGRKLFPQKKVTSYQAPSKYMSPAERKLLKGAG